MKILITGAHFTPAVAVIEELKKIPNTKIIYIGRSKTMEGDQSLSVESKVLPSLGVKFISINTGRVQRAFTIYTLYSLFKIPIGFIQSFFIILFQRPDVILSFGGYVAVPVIICGWFFSIPLIIHEQTLVTGLANRISSFFADKLATSFNKNDDLGREGIFTGNPIRKEVLSPIKKINREFQKLFNNARAKKLPVILFMGGNQGSHIINLIVEESLRKLLKIACVIHITGDNKFNDFDRLHALEKFKGGYLVKKWVGKEYGAILRKVDLVICRSGINTLNELAFLGKPALVVPIPYLYKNEQHINATFFKNLGLLEILPQSNLSAQSLLRKINSMLNHLDNLNEKAKTAKKIIKVDAAKRLALETILLAKNK